MASQSQLDNPPKAYSYLRFSSKEQEHGDSARRQTDLARAYALKHGLTLDTQLTYEDRGIPAFRGQNVALGGKLALFQEAIRAGCVPQGSVLLVESLDRISRDDALIAQSILTQIIMSGVSVVTLLDEKLYSLETYRAEPMNLVYSVLLFMRANEESATKSRRLKQAWGAKRDRAAGGKPFTAVAPAWIKVDLEAGTIELDADRAAIVRRIFDLTLTGVGQHSIAEQFNREGIEPWGRGKRRAKFWQRSYIAKILANRAVIGTMTPHVMDYTSGVKTRKALESLPDYFPAVVTPEVFADVQALGASKRAPGRGKAAGAPLSNVLAGLAQCPLCGSTMTRVQKGSRSRPSLVCVKAKAGAGCSYRSIPYAYVEMAILERLAERLRDIPAGGPGNDDDEQAIINVSELQDALKRQGKNLLKNLAYGPSPTLVAELQEVENQLDSVTATLKALLEKREATSGPLWGDRAARVLAILRPEPPEGADVPGAADLADTVNRAALNAALRGIFKSAVINYKHGSIEFEWQHGGMTDLPFMLMQ